jgi:cardiolipin synthase
MTLPDALRLLTAALLALLSLYAAGHALLHKRDPRSGLGWVYVCLTFPLLGPLLYSTFGVNRIRTLGRRLLPTGAERGRGGELPDEVPAEMLEIAKTSNAVTRRPLVPGNAVEELFDGEGAYPAMLAEIEGARRSIDLSTYLWDTDEVGRGFVEALGAAAARGVEVRVLIDGIGEWYSLPRVGPLLARRGVRVERFLRPTPLRPNLHLNLRNHRKILVVDGEVGFTGGMNIGGRHMVSAPENRRRTRDVQFRVRGPVVAQLAQAFLEDWAFAAGEPAPEREPPAPPPAGGAWCRGISVGPNEDYDALTWILGGALTTARRRVRIMTPYFVPIPELITSLNNAALRGVEVDVLLPLRSNLRFVDWATRAMVWEMMRHGVRFHVQLPPFAHTKILLVDDHYAQVGSANLDPRSLKLNFEFQLEVFDAALVARLDEHVRGARAQARELRLEELERLALPLRLRNATARLFAPYL